MLSLNIKYRHNTAVSKVLRRNVIKPSFEHNTRSRLQGNSQTNRTEFLKI